MRLDSAWTLLALCAVLGGCESTTNATAPAVPRDAEAVLPRADASTRPESLDAGVRAPGAGHDAALDSASPEDAASMHDAASGAHDAEASFADATSSPLACSVSAPTTCPTPMPRYADVEPIFRQRCVVCHAPVGTGPWPLNDYQHVSDWQFDIRADLLSCAMPPPDAGVELPATERTQILTWLRCGLPK